MQRMSPTSIKAVLFDLDDTLWPLEVVIKRAESTLYDWLSVHAPGITQRFTQDGLRALRAELLPTDARYRHDLWALRHATLVRACEECNEDSVRMLEAMAVFSAARNAVTPFDDVAPGLENLGRQYLIGSISNGFADLEAIGLAHHFKTSLAAHQFGAAKPDASIFLAACDALQVAPHKALYVGDDPYLDVEGAQKAGLHAGWMNRFDRPFPDGIVPNARFTSLHDIDLWLQRTA